MLTKFFTYLKSPRLKEHMQYCIDHPEEISKLSKLKAQITEVKGIMMDNIEKVKRFLYSFIMILQVVDHSLHICL